MSITTDAVFRKYTSPENFAMIRPYDSLCAMWADVCARFADHDALSFAGETVTYAGLEERAAVIRGRLRDAGIAPGACVALLAENGIAFAEGFLGIVTAGCTAAVLPTHLPAPAVAGCCRMFRAAALLHTPKTAAAAEGAPVPALSLDGSAAAPAPMAERRPEDGCAILFTGGTTGKSKGVMLSHRAVVAGTSYGCYGTPAFMDQRYILALPLTHVFGLVRNLLTALYTGSVMHICQSNTDLFRDMAAFRPTVWVTVPALAEMALSLNARFGGKLLGASLKTVICGAAAVPPYLIRQYHALGIALYPGYGLTETANLVSGNPEPLRKPESVGLPFPGQELKIVDGELLIRGVNLMDGYVGAEPDALADGWLHTGDLARFDEDGFLYITGRSKEIIVLPTGENISPAEVELHFSRLEAVKDCQVFEDLDESGRHILALEVTLRESALPALGDNPARAAEALLWQANAELPSFQRVSRITVRDTDFERTPAMKIVRYHKC